MPATRFLGGADFLDLLERAFFVHAVGDGDGLGVIGQRDVFVAQVARGRAHLFDGVFAVRGGAYASADRREYRQSYEFGERVFFGGVDFAEFLAQLGLDVGELQLRIDFLFGLAGDDFAALEGRERVFVERLAHVEGAAAQRHVVLLRAGEIEQGRAEAFLFEQPYVHLQAAGQQEADFVFAVRQASVDSRDISGCVRRRRRYRLACRGRASESPAGPGRRWFRCRGAATCRA